MVIIVAVVTAAVEAGGAREADVHVGEVGGHGRVAAVSVDFDKSGISRKIFVFCKIEKM